VTKLVAVHWSPEAFDDLHRLHAFLQDKSPDAAMRAVAAIRTAVDRLRLFPESGRPLDSLPTQYRELLVNFGTGGYVVHYFASVQTIEVLSVRHFREDSPPRP
jgi:plasmid stabilization system protein ParE